MTGYIWPYPTENIKIIITFFSGYYLYATNWRHWSFLEVLIIKIGQCDFVDIIRSLLCVKWKEPEKRLLMTWIKMEHFVLRNFKFHCSGRSRTAGTSKMELFVIIVNRWKPLTIITKSSILDVSAVLDPPLHISHPLLFVLPIKTWNLSKWMQTKFTRYIKLPYLNQIRVLQLLVNVVCFSIIAKNISVNDKRNWNNLFGICKDILD